MADDQTPEVAPEAVSQPADANPQATPTSAPDAVVDAGTEPQVTPDPQPASTPSTSSEPSTSTSCSPVVVTNLTARDDNDARLGSFVDVVSGEYAGRVGAYIADVSHDSTGYPERVIVRTRDADNLLIEVSYSDLRPSAYTGGR